jgi:NitT/TauT family transport system permease protein
MVAAVRSTSRLRFEQIATPFALLALAVVWEVAGQISGALFFPPLTEILRAWLGLVTSGELLEASVVSVQTLVLGYVAALVLGAFIGMAMGLFRPVEHLLDLYVNTFMAAPNIALIPLIALFIGLDIQARAFVVFLFAFFPIVLTSEAAIRSVEPSFIEMGRSFGMNWGSRLRRVILPSALPAIIGGARLAFIRAVGAVIGAEIFLASAGLGRLMHQYGTAFRPAELFSIVFTVVAAAILFGGLFSVVQRRVGRWQRGMHAE